MIKICKQCNKEFKSYNKNPKFCSLKCKGVCQSKTLLGSNNPNYRGGKTRCIDCEKELAQRYSYRDTKRCRTCASKLMRGAGCWRYTGKYIQEGNRTYSVCVNCNSQTGDRLSAMCRKCYRGKNHPMWKGGISGLNTRIRSLPENRQWIKQCMYRDDYVCQQCGVESKRQNLQVHHIKSLACIIRENNISTLEQAQQCEELWDMTNGVTLCKDCHKLTTNYCNKKLCH